LVSYVSRKPKSHMKISAIELADVKVLEPDLFVDDRGFFLESYNKRAFMDVGITVEFVQDNFSRSSQNVLRGLHYQIKQAQGKLVRVTSGEIVDVIVDIRRNSPSFGHWTSVVLSSENNKMLWVPIGFAHGYAVISEVADVLYKTTDYYAPSHERSILWNDPDLHIDWKLDGPPILSKKDAGACRFVDAEVFE